RSGLINHTVASNGPVYSVVGVDGVAVNVFDPAVALVAIHETGGNTTVVEGGITDNYSIRLTAQPTAPVYLTVSAGIATTQDRVSQSASILVSSNGTVFRR